VRVAVVVVHLGHGDVLVQLALKPHPNVPNVPTIIDLARNAEERAVTRHVEDLGSAAAVLRALTLATE
jgi:hypothetical protein